MSSASLRPTRLLLLLAVATALACLPEMNRPRPDQRVDRPDVSRDAPRPGERAEAAVLDRKLLADASCKPAGAAAATLKGGEGQKHPAALVSDGSSLYWANSDYYAGSRTGCDGRVMRLSASGALSVLGSFEENVDALAVDDDRVYWAWTTSPAGKVVSCRKDGSGRLVIADNLAQPVVLAARGKKVYWLTGGPDGWLMRHAGDSSSGAPELLCGEAQKDPSTIAISADGQRVFWAAKGATQYEIRVHDGTSCKTLRGVSEPSNPPRGLTVDGADLYWVTSGTAGGGDGAVWRMPASGSTPAASVSNGNQARPMRLAIQGGQIYWTCHDGGTVRSAPKTATSHPGDLLASGEVNVFAIAADACNVYWTIDALDGAIRARGR